MSKTFKIITFFSLVFFFFTNTHSKENYFDEALKKFQSEKYEDARFLLERNIVFNPSIVQLPLLIYQSLLK